MESTRPMDRLLCGDVGFGKTEVAMRAAFKAVDNGYQVAVMVPTTILAEQHYHTFRERMAEFPFKSPSSVGFCTAAEQREIVEGLAEGEHRRGDWHASAGVRDVQFHNLGLVIIDEEQRFGVEVKERLKQLRSTVDVLTMTATPIPRTLHMSLTGHARHLESRRRRPTTASRWKRESRRLESRADSQRRAARTGSRRTEFTLSTIASTTFTRSRQSSSRSCPRPPFESATGKWPKDDLEQVMVDFVARHFDLLLATTIVESGLDIPNANTIFIDEADRYGLADLHQLRGRVGRYKHRAYCYLLVDPHKHITPDAARRLRAIEEFSEMGAGFAIAMRDLEIRGAGNLLGTQQSGHIAAVGYELYCQLLEAAVRRMKQLPPKLQIDVNIDLPGEAYILRRVHSRSTDEDRRLSSHLARGERR